MKIFSIFFAIVASIILFYTSFASAAAAFNPAFSVNTKTNRIIDSYGRARFFHGANVVVKSFPFIPDTNDWNPNTSFVEKDMEALQSLGMNGIRLGAMFPGVMPSQGYINQTYLDALKQIVEKSASYGIHSLLDMHQDVMSEFFCGEGFPQFLVNESIKNIPANMSFPWPAAAPYETDQYGIPLPSECKKESWSVGYFSYAATTSFQNFYDNVNGMRDVWASAWQAIAAKFADVGDAVLGLELLNEPFCGAVFAGRIRNTSVFGPELLIPGIADLVNLQPTWDHGAAAIRQVNTQHPIFFEPITWDWLEPGFTSVPGGPAFANKSVLAFHYYSPPDLNAPIEFAGVQKKTEELNCASFLSEFGVSSCPSCQNRDAAMLMDLVDTTLQSGFLYWDFKPMTGPKTGYGYSIWNADGSVNHEIRELISRTYAQAVAGVPVSHFFNRTTNVYTLVFTTDASISGNYKTEIYYNTQYHYPSGFTVTAVASDASVTVPPPTRTGTHIILETPPSVVPVGVTITVTVTPANSEDKKILGDLKH